NAVETVGQGGLVLAQLDREAVAGPAARRAAEYGLQARMLRDESGHAGPGREREQSLDKASTDQHARAESLTATSTRDKRVNRGCYLGGVEKSANVANSR